MVLKLLWWRHPITFPIFSMTWFCSVEFHSLHNRTPFKLQISLTHLLTLFYQLKHVPLHIFRIFFSYHSTSLVILVVHNSSRFYVSSIMNAFWALCLRIQALEKTRNRKQRKKNCLHIIANIKMHILFFNITLRMVFISAMLTQFEYFQCFAMEKKRNFPFW